MKPITSLVLAAFSTLFVGSFASATVVPIKGVGSEAYYGVNILYLPDESNPPTSLKTTTAASVTYTYGGGAVQGMLGDTLDGDIPEHRASGMNQAGAFMTALITLDQPNYLNRFVIEHHRFRNNANTSYQLRLFDGSTWTDLGVTAIGAKTDTVIKSFSTQRVTQIEYTIFGSPTADPHVGISEFNAFVSAAAPSHKAPHVQDGYNLGTIMTVDSDSGTANSGESPQNAIDGSYSSLSRFNATLGGWAIFDLGGVYPVERLRPVMLNITSLTENFTIEVGATKSAWTTVHSGPLTSLTQFIELTNAQTRAGVRYIRWTVPPGAGGATLAEFQVFATWLPEPAAGVLMLGAAGLLCRRWRA
jgi:hypothetical protein